MKVLQFDYRKEDGQQKSYELVVLKEINEGYEGISMKELSEEDRNSLLAVIKEFEEKLNPYMKNYRRFKKANIVARMEE